MSQSGSHISTEIWLKMCIRDSLDILFANTAGFVVSLIFNYVASMKFVFEHKDGMSRRREFIIFVVDVYKRQPHTHIPSR